MEKFLGPQVFQMLIDVGRIAAWLAIFTAIFLPLERLFAVHPHKIFRKGIVTDLGYFFLNGMFTAFLLSFPIAWLTWVVHKFIPSGITTAGSALPLWARMIATMVAGEFGYYWGHRLSHEIPFLWRFHSIHHSAEEMDFLVATRAHPLDMVFGRFCSLVPLYLFGLGGSLGPKDSLVPLVVFLIGSIWGTFIHANVRWRMGPFEWLFTTPAFHHWHHTKTGPINHNYSTTLPWVDRIFGTYHLPKEFPSDYGIKATVPESLVEQLVYPLMPPMETATRPETASADTTGPA